MPLNIYDGYILPKQIFVTHFVDKVFSTRKQPTFRDATPGFLAK